MEDATRKQWTRRKIILVTEYGGRVTAEEQVFFLAIKKGVIFQCDDPLPGKLCGLLLR